MARKSTRSLVLGLAAVALLGGCGRTATSTTTARRARPASLRFTRCGGAHPDGWRCAALIVPRLRGSGDTRTKRLRVTVHAPARGPVRDTVLFLAGGPGQDATDLRRRIEHLYGRRLPQDRLVLFDVPGTGHDAPLCPALQRAMGTSDLAVPPPVAVSECEALLAPHLGEYSTLQTTTDLDQLRAALGARRLVIVGTSWGTYVAEHYALLHADRVSALVLDSVVPQNGGDPLQRANLRAIPGVLRRACALAGCHVDPSHDIAAAVRHGANAPALLDLLVGASIGHPRLAAVVPALRAAARGSVGRLRRVERAAHRHDTQVPLRIFSSGSHAATLCGDNGAPPFGAPGARGFPPPGALSGFDRAASAGNGWRRLCAQWKSQGRGEQGLPQLRPRTLLLAGELDLSTPLAWARQQAAETLHGTLLVVRGSGHSVLGQSECARRALQTFLLSPARPLPRRC